jgi:MoaA/NifB/PqqE/SkfB family radical SAM enzyme
MYNLAELIRDGSFLDDLDASVAGRQPPPLLRCVKIKLTSRCNLRCVMCRYGRTRGEELVSSARWQEIFSELAALGCRKVHFSGGEVFLRRDFLELAEGAVAQGLKVNLTTNGTLIDKARARRLAAIGVNGVSISLDGPRAKEHDRIRGRAGAFKATLHAIRLLRREAPRVKLRVNCVLMRRNYAWLPEMVALAGALEVDELIPMPVDEKGRRKNRLSAPQIRNYNREVAPRVAELRQRLGFSTAPAFVFPFGVTDAEIRASAKGLYARGAFERRPCLAPWLHSFFAWNGDAFACCMTNGRMEPLGNVGRTPVAEVFRGAGYDALRAAFRAGNRLPACDRCDLFLAENALLHAALDERRHTARAGRVGLQRPGCEAEQAANGLL